MESNKMEEIPRCDLFSLLRFTMKFGFMYPMNLKDYFLYKWQFICNSIEIVLEMIMYFISLHIPVLYAFSVYFSYGNGDLVYSVNCLSQLFIYSWAAFMKIYFRRISPRLLNDLMESINKEFRTRSAPGLTYVTMEEAHMLSNKFLKCFIFGCYVATIFMSILPIAYNDRSLPLTCWYPFDYKESYIYETIYFIQILGQLQVATAFATSTGFHMSLAVLISGEYDVLYCSLKNIIATTYITMGTMATKCLRELEIQQQSQNTERNQYYCAKEHTDDYTYSLQPQLILGNIKPLSFFQASKISFKNCVMHHRSILRMLKKMEHFFNFIWIIKFGEIIIVLCLVAFATVKTTIANSAFMKLFSLAQYLFMVIWELLIICYFGELIYLNSQRCGEAILRCPWYLHMREMKHDFLIFLINSQRAFSLTAGKMYFLDITRFRAVITTAFSFFTILQNMDK